MHEPRRFPIARFFSFLALTFAAGCSDPAETPPPAGDPFGPIGDRADLPVTERIKIDNLAAPVDVVRDKDGRPHIFASSFEDAVRVQGYLVAQDRHLQIEFYRRVSEGRLAEILADADASVIDNDIVFRSLGLHRVAKKQYEVLGPEEKALVDAFADGVSQHFRALRNREAGLPAAAFLVPVDAFTDFTGVDALAIARLQSYLLSHSADGELADTISIQTIGAAFPKDAADPLVALRSGILRELYRFAPYEPATTTTGYPMGQGGAKAPAPSPLLPDLGARTSRYREALRKVKDLFAPEGFGSNNWAVTAGRSDTGHALLASDPHLTLAAPAIFWPVAMEVTPKDPSARVKVSGLAFPGIPGIILGHNENIAWGATVAGYDVTDLYAEQITPDGKSVVFEGKNVAIETVDEVIQIQAGTPYTYKVPVVPHHGAILPEILPDHTVAPLDPAKGAVSVRWTGDEATNELAAILALLRSKNVDEAKLALDGFQVGAQNWMIADTQGNVLWTSHAKLPTRKPAAVAWNPATFSGTLPCLVLPGDGSAEWTGALPDHLVPWEKNPAAGFLATANNDPIGDSLDNDPSNGTLPDGTPMYLACSWDIGFREGRIKERLAALDKATPEDLAKIQGDAKSALGSRLVPAMIEAIDRAEAERKAPGTHPDLSAVVADPGYDAAAIQNVHALLTAWGTEAGYEAASGIDPDTNKPLPAEGDTAIEVRASQATLVFNTWLLRLVERVLGDELEHAGRPFVPRDQKAKAILAITRDTPASLPTYDPTTKESALWDDMATPEIETKHERIVRALVDALGTLAADVGTDIGAYRWGARHRVRFEAILPILGQLSIPPLGDPVFPDGFPRHGDSFSVDSSDFSLTARLDVTPRYDYDFGPTQRLVVDLAPEGPRSWNALPGGVVWDSQSPHFRDQAELWRKNQTRQVPFLLTDVVAAAASRIVVTGR
ncbi:penicillin acylase family protein [Polyangium jinanense]|uniref:penicillin acylase family protein n=1 Tax=Polyangium jinanense TaxID=2829994 RepID=UPI002341630E|nr:penicillin acylase family protein [Polyangium jinanense]MDC3952346.1 penicillin acylase family protein [Polyangium jinanense]